MTNRNDDRDTKPWYRQFWPWFIICLPGSAVIASLYTVSLAVRTTDSLVLTASGGIDVVAERHLAAERRAIQMGLEARIDIDSESGAIHVNLYSDVGDEWPTRLELLFSHPTHAHRDRSVTLERAMSDEQGNPSWTGHVVTVPTGRWYLVLEAGESWRLNGSWSGAPTVRLLPASTR